MIKDAAGLAVRSLLLEASLAPKPGLVTPYDNGSHKDMNFKTFVDSALALFPCFAECAAAGRAFARRPPEETLPSLREAGRDGEKAMYRATGGVNTHKGAIYLLGFLCAAVGRFQATDLSPGGLSPRGLSPRDLSPWDFSPRDLTRTAASFARGVVARELAPLKLAPLKLAPLKNSAPLTAGERAYVAQGFAGARGEVEGGYPLASKALAFLARLPPMPFKNALTDAFFFIVAENDDTNLYARGGIEGLREARALAGDVLRSGGTSAPLGREKIRLAERVFVEKNLSPGGSADILSSAIFLLHAARGL